ncbi:hypothetical protein C8J57DRAFT_215401 [Mycena rebaudengoi]|nr:hypothetical protein C8J57DRAFT_215401 [Mycena rebaudengoi]
MHILYDRNKLLNWHSIFSAATFHLEQVDPKLLYLQGFSPPPVLYNWDKPLNWRSIFSAILNLKKVVLNLLYLQAFGLTRVFCNWDKPLDQHSIFSVDLKLLYVQSLVPTCVFCDWNKPLNSCYIFCGHSNFDVQFHPNVLLTDFQLPCTSKEVDTRLPYPRQQGPMHVLYDRNKLLNWHSIFFATLNLVLNLLYLHGFSPLPVLYSWDKPLN